MGRWWESDIHSPVAGERVLDHLPGALDGWLKLDELVSLCGVRLFQTGEGPRWDPDLLQQRVTCIACQAVLTQKALAASEPEPLRSLAAGYVEVLGCWE